MYLDVQNLFDPAGTAITAGGASANIIDLSVGRDIGAGAGPLLDIFGVVTQSFAAAGAATLVASVQMAADNAGVPGTWYDAMMTGAMPVANLLAGVEILRLPVPLVPQVMMGGALPRFLRLNYVVATGPFTAGQVETGLILHSGRQANVAYKSGFNAFN